jgi:hypothetical protein
VPAFGGLNKFKMAAVAMVTKVQNMLNSRSRQKHDKNVWEWSHVLGEGMDFQAKEWSFCLGMVSRISEINWILRFDIFVAALIK